MSDLSDLSDKLDVMDRFDVCWAFIGIMYNNKSSSRSLLLLMANCLRLEHLRQLLIFKEICIKRLMI